MAKIVGRNSGLRFNTSAQKAKRTRRKIIAIFAVVFVVLASASIITFFHERTSEENTDPNEITVPVNANLQENVNLFVAGVSTNERELLFASFITLNTAEQTITVSCAASGSGAIVERPAEFASQMASKYGIELDRYIFIDQKQFKKVYSLLGNYSTNIKKRVDYHGDDFTLELLSGQQSFTYDKFFNYIRYVGMNGSKYELKEQAGIIAEYVSKFMSEKNAEKGVEIYEKTMNASESNISPTDFLKYKDLLDEMAKESVRAKVDTVKMGD